MPQLHLYVPEELASKLRQRAELLQMSVSKYLAELVKREMGSGWPPGYFDNISGKWQGEFPNIERIAAEPLDEDF